MNTISKKINTKTVINAGMILSYGFLLYVNVKSWQILSFAPAILFLMVSIYMTWQYFSFVRNTANIFNIVFLATLVLYLQAVLYPGIAFIKGVFRASYFASAQIDLFWGLIIWLIGCAAFFVGLRMLRVPDISLIKQPVKRDDKAFLITLPLIVLSFGASAITIYNLGGIGIILDSSVASDTIRLSRGMGFLTLFQFMSYIAVAYLGWDAFLNKSRIKRILILLLGTAYCIIGSAVKILQARRGVLLYHLVLLYLPFIIKIFLRKRSYILSIILAILIIDDTTSIIRENYYRTNKIELNYVLETLKYNKRPVPLSYDHLYLTAALHSRITANQFSYKQGLTFIAGIINWIPRKIFPNKPWTAGPYLANAMTEESSYYYDDQHRSSSMTTGLILESYMNFGVIGVPVILFITGTWISIANKRMQSNRPSMFSFTLWSIVTVFIVNIFADDFGGLVNKSVALGIGMIFLYFIRKVLIRNDQLRKSC